MDPHFNAHHHPFSINSIIAATNAAEAANKAAVMSTDMKLYEMGYTSAYPSSLSPLGPGAESTTPYYHHHPTAASLYHTTTI